MKIIVSIRARVENGMRILILFVTLCPILQGCVGGVVDKGRTKVTSHPAVSIYREVCEQNSAEAANTNLYITQCTSEWLRQHWGSPSHVKRRSGAADEIWTYSSRSAWEGVTPYLIIPIPLVLPVGSENVSFTIHNGQVVSASKTEPVSNGWTYGGMFNPEGGALWGLWHWEDDKIEKVTF